MTPSQLLDSQAEQDLARRIIQAEREARHAIAELAPAQPFLSRKRPKTERTRAGDVDALTEAVAAVTAAAKADRSLLKASRQARGALAQAEALRWELAMSGRRVALAEARKLAGAFLDYEDLLQEGFVGLMRAAKRFDPDRGIRFSTYARWWVRAALTRAVDNTGRTVRLPGCAVEQRRNLRKVMTTFEQAGLNWTLNDLAAEANLEKDRVSFLLTQGKTMSLDEPLGAEGGARSVGTLIADESAEDPMERTIQAQEVYRLQLTLDEQLSERQRYVVRHRFGLDGHTPRSLAAIGRSLSLSRERVRQIERDALSRMRAAGTIRATPQAQAAS